MSSQELRPLAGKVAVVSGASRGIGKGIALALAEQGATVYVTGRTVTPGSYPLPGTVGETAVEVDRRGGKGIAVQVDHARDDQVAALFDQVKREQGCLDILVNNAFSLPEDLTEPRPFWEKPLSNLQMFDVGMRSNFVAAWHAAKLMVPQESGLIVATSGYVGLTFTERAERNLGRNPAMKSQTVTNPLVGSSVEFPGRVIVALATDPNIMQRSGGTFIAAELAREYGVTDIDGNVPPSLREQRGSPIWSPI